MAVRKVTPRIELELLAKAAEGQTTRALAAWMLEAHKIKISHQAIGNLLNKTRTERAQVAKAVVAEKLGKTVGSDLDRLEQIRRDLAEVSAVHFENAKTDPESVGAFTRVAELEVKVIDRKLHYSGANEESKSETNGDLEAARERLTTALERLADSAESEGPSAVH